MVTFKKQPFCLAVERNVNLYGSYLFFCYLWLMTRAGVDIRESRFSQKQVCTTRTVGWLAADKQTDKLPPCKNIPISTLNLTYKNNNNNN